MENNFEQKNITKLLEKFFEKFERKEYKEVVEIFEKDILKNNKTKIRKDLYKKIRVNEFFIKNESKILKNLAFSYLELKDKKKSEAFERKFKEVLEKEALKNKSDKVGVAEVMLKTICGMNDLEEKEKVDEKINGSKKTLLNGNLVTFIEEYFAKSENEEVGVAIENKQKNLQTSWAKFIKRGVRKVSFGLF